VWPRGPGEAHRTRNRGNNSSSRGGISLGDRGGSRERYQRGSFEEARWTGDASTAAYGRAHEADRRSTYMGRRAGEALAVGPVTAREEVRQAMAS
jgi:hypothetical protein